MDFEPYVHAREEEEKRLVTNTVNTLQKAATEVDWEKVDIEQFNPEFGRRWGAEASNVSDETLQQLWARLLKGELESPGSVSNDSMTVARDMTKERAEEFQILCSAALYDLHKPESTDGRREGWANWDEGAYKGESLGSIGTDVTRQRVFSSRTGPGERSMEAGNRVIVRSDAAGCTRGPGGREFGGVGSVADSAVRMGVGWLAVGPGREWPAQPRASPGEDEK